MSKLGEISSFRRRIPPRIFRSSRLRWRLSPSVIGTAIGNEFYARRSRSSALSDLGTWFGMKMDSIGGSHLFFFCLRLSSLSSSCLLFFSHEAKNTARCPLASAPVNWLPVLCYENSSFPTLPADSGGQVNGDSLSFCFIDSPGFRHLTFPRWQNIQEQSECVPCNSSAVLSSPAFGSSRYISGSI